MSKRKSWEPPDSFVVQEQEWQTVYAAELINKLEGLCQPGGCRIVLSPTLAKEARGETWLHELLHACVNFSGSRTADEEQSEWEERLISGLAPVLWATLRRNKLRFD